MNPREQRIIAAADKGDVNTMNDALFKFVLGKEDAKHLTIDFLNAALGPDLSKPIEDLTFLQTENSPKQVLGKETRFDVACRLDSGERVDVEVQVLDQNNMRRRTYYYWSQLYQRDFCRGAAYESLSPALTVNVLDFVLFEDDPNPYSWWSTYNSVTHKRFGRDLSFFFLEIPKFERIPHSGGHFSPIERWMCYFSPRTSFQAKDSL